MSTKVMTAILAGALILGPAAPAVAAQGVDKPASSGAALHDPSLTFTRRAQLKSLSDAKDSALGTGEHKLGCTCVKSGSVSVACLPATGMWGYVTLPVTNYKQERSYWCGPASARQTLSFHKTRSKSTATLPSQTALATKIATTPEGSITTKITSVLNSYDGTFGNVYYVSSNLTDQTDPLGRFYGRIGSVVSQHVTGGDAAAPIILAATQYIPRYGGHISRHYITMSGIDDRTAPVEMRTTDCNSNTAYYGVHWNPVGCTAHNGVFLACYKADVAGTNMAMSW